MRSDYFVMILMLSMASVLITYYGSYTEKRYVYDTAKNLQRRIDKKLRDAMPSCCKALTKECLSCAAGLMVKDFCKRHQGEYGCPVNRPEPRSKVCIVTAFKRSTKRELFKYDDYEKIIPISISNMWEYSKRFNYSLFLFNEDVFDDERKASWVKIPLILKYFKQCDWVMYTDVDWLFLSNKPLPIDNDYDIIVSNECIKGNEWKKMSGTMILKNSPWTKKLLKTWDKMYKKYKNVMNHDQVAFENMVRDTPKQMKVMPPEEFMSYDTHNCVKPKFGVHFPGPNKFLRMKKFDTKKRHLSVTISNTNINYHIPYGMKNAEIVIGVLSSDRNKRSEMRRMYDNIYFMVGKENFDYDEFYRYNDMIFIDKKEEYMGENSILPYKSQVFFHVVQQNIKFKYLLKMDDDTYVKMDQLKKVLEEEKPDYWGKVWRNNVIDRNPKSKWYVSRKTFSRNRYPDYCSGAGYVLSTNAVSCMVKKLHKFKYMPMEDVATGLLAEQCNIKASNSDMVQHMKPYKNDNYIIRHYYKYETSVFDIDKTFDLLKQGYSISRFGDGEIMLMEGKSIAFQSYDPRLAKKLRAIKNDKNFCIGTVPILDGIPGYFTDPNYWKPFQTRMKLWFKGSNYCNSFITRMDNVKGYSKEYFEQKWQAIFQNKRVLVIHSSSLSTIDNSVFDRHLKGSKVTFLTSVHGKDIPTKNAFSMYDDILAAALKAIRDKDIEAVAISLGPTASVLAYELYKHGYTALDVGQFSGSFTLKENFASTKNILDNTAEHVKLCSSSNKKHHLDLGYEKLVSVMNSLNIKLKLAHGTLLGWARNCEFIASTGDLDFTIDEDDANKIDIIISELKKHGIVLKEILGNHYCRNMEIKLKLPTDTVHQRLKGIHMDIFVEYNQGKDSYFAYHTGATSWNKVFYTSSEAVETSYKGKKVFVPIKYEKQLEEMYGNWKTPVKWEYNGKAGSYRQKKPMQCISTKNIQIRGKPFTVSKDTNGVYDKQGFWRLVSSNIWEKETYDVLDTIQTDEVVVDFGAWIGPVTIYASKLAKYVYAVEPDKSAFRLLRENVELNKLQNVKTINMGFHSSFSSIQSKNGDQGNSETIFVEGGNTPSMKLSSFLKDKGNKLFIKFDCEGCEHDLFQDLTSFKNTFNGSIRVWISIHPSLVDVSEVKELIKTWKVLKVNNLSYLLSN